MKRKKAEIDRRAFVRSTLIKTSLGLAALNELFGPGLVARGARYVTAAETHSTGSHCQIVPASVYHGDPPLDWTITYRAGAKGLARACALAIRCPKSLTAANEVTVTSSWPSSQLMLSSA